MSAHTPGLWSIVADEGQIIPQHGTVVAYVTGSNEADARLIAAAPELLEALKDAVAAHPPSYIHRGTGKHDPELLPAPEWVAAARAAIAKAEGQS